MVRLLHVVMDANRCPHTMHTSRVLVKYMYQVNSKSPAQMIFYSSVNHCLAKFIQRFLAVLVVFDHLNFKILIRILKLE